MRLVKLGESYEDFIDDRDVEYREEDFNLDCGDFRGVATAILTVNHDRDPIGPNVPPCESEVLLDGTFKETGEDGRRTYRYEVQDDPDEVPDRFDDVCRMLGRVQRDTSVGDELYDLGYRE